MACLTEQDFSKELKQKLQTVFDQWCRSSLPSVATWTKTCFASLWLAFKYLNSGVMFHPTYLKLQAFFFFKWLKQYSLFHMTLHYACHILEKFCDTIAPLFKRYEGNKIKQNYFRLGSWENITILYHNACDLTQFLAYFSIIYKVSSSFRKRGW